MSNIRYQTDLIYGLNEIVTEPGSLGIGVVKDEGKVRFVITGAGASNEVLVRGRINNQQTWNTLATFTGNVNDLVEVFTYDELEVICSVFDPANGYDFRLVASSFDSNKITVVTPDGTLDNFNTLTLTSLDETILFNTDPLTGSIDLSAVGGGGGGGYQAYANLAAFPPVGTVGVIYVANDTKKIYRWLSPSYIELSPSEVTSVNTKVGAVVLDKTDIGLGNVDNTSDVNKPISSATQTALNAKENTSNKSIDGTLAGNSDTLYPSQKAVKTYVDASSASIQSQLDASIYYHELHVNYDYTGVTVDGSPYKPFKTIQAAVNAAQLQNVGGNTAILVHLKKDITMVEDIVVNNAVSNLYIMPAVYNNTDSSPLKIVGSLTISGASTNRVRVQDISFSPTSGYALIVNDTNGRHMFQNCQFTNGSIPGQTGTGVNLTSTYRNFIEFIDCTIEGTVNIAGTPVAGTTVTMYRSRLTYANVIVNSANVAVGMYDTYGIYGLTHTAGALSLVGLWGILGFFNSTANASATNFLSLSNLSLQKYDLTFVPLNKTGTCLYQLINVHRGETADVLTGTRAVYGPTATDAGYKMGVSGNWSPAVSNVAGALDQLAANKISTSEKGAANGVAPLNASTKIDSTYLPSYVDDVLEFANLASFPNPGSIGIIYVALDTNLIYRWTGSTYVEISPSQALVWGAITGTLSSQTDLQNALDGKANTSHTQALSTLTQSGATTGQVPVWNGTAWAPGVPAGTATWGGISGTLSSQTDLQSALNGKFNNPTGDTTQYIAGDGTLITFPSTSAADRLQTTVYNETGATIPKMSVIYLDGPHGNLPKIVLAIADNETDSALTYGIIQNDIGNMSSGICVEAGRLENLNTNIAGWAEGDVLYLSPTVLGGITNIKPTAPNQLVIVGVLVRKHPSQGVIQVKIQNGYEINELHNVLINGSLAANQTLKYDSVTSLWKNQYIGLASDIEQTSFSITNNQNSAANVTGLSFAAASVRSFNALVTVSIDATADLFETFELIGTNKSGSFEMSISSTGDDSGVIFSITAAGQIQYTSSNYLGFVSGTIKFRAITTTV